jgi:nucleotide-binding universal stress UspA family protein
MKKLFNKILVPVDFSLNTEVVIEGVLDFAKQYHCKIHLLHVTSLYTLAHSESAVSDDGSSKKTAPEFQLEKLSRRIDFLSNDQMHVEYSVIKGSWNQALIDFADEHNIDLILISQREQFLLRKKMLFNPDLIAEKTNIPVITVPVNRSLTSMYSIVIPITDFLPVRKLMYGVYIAINFGATITLLAIENIKTRQKVQVYLEKAEKIIRENCSVQVEKKTVVNGNVANAIQHFATQKSVDLIIVNPGVQTKMPGLLSSILGDILQRYADLPVLTVNPV